MDVQTQFFTYGVDDSDKLNLSNGHHLDHSHLPMKRMVI